MNFVATELLPPALGVAVSPLPVMIVLLLLVAKNVRSAVGYVVGWMLGILVVGVAFVLLSDVSLDRGDRSESFAIAVAMLALGAIFLLMAGLQMLSLRKRSRPLAGPADGFSPASALPPARAQATTTQDAAASSAATARQMSLATTAPLALESNKPGWMQAIDRISPWLALAIALLSAFNPKNLSLILIAVADIHEAGFSVTGGSLAFLSFVALSTVTVAAPLVYWAAKREGADAALRSAEQWLSQNQVYIMAGLFLVLGIMAILKGWARLPA